MNSEQRAANYRFGQLAKAYDLLEEAERMYNAFGLDQAVGRRSYGCQSRSAALSQRITLAKATAELHGVPLANRNLLVYNMIDAELRMQTCRRDYPSLDASADDYMGWEANYSYWRRAFNRAYHDLQDWDAWSSNPVGDPEAAELLPF